MRLTRPDFLYVSKFSFRCDTTHKQNTKQKTQKHNTFVVVVVIMYCLKTSSLHPPKTSMGWWDHRCTVSNPSVQSFLESSGSIETWIIDAKKKKPLFWYLPPGQRQENEIVLANQPLKTAPPYRFVIRSMCRQTKYSHTPSCQQRRSWSMQQTITHLYAITRFFFLLHRRPN